jgi:hypothetical protein
MLQLSGETTVISLVVDLDRARYEVEPFAEIHVSHI